MSPDFTIPSNPRPNYLPNGDVEYDGQTTFALTPTDALGDDELRTLVRGVLDEQPYTYGDWFDLPAPVYLVYDREAGDVFRVVLRGGRVELHVLPNTGSAGLRDLYDRLSTASGLEWTVERRSTAAD